LAISHAGPRQLLAARRADVVADDAPAGGLEIARERAAHDAEADDADRAFIFLFAKSAPGLSAARCRA
jgi:hypothetical protein